MNDLNQMIPHALLSFVPFLFALCVHEYAHGWVANKLGDPTAKLMGRLTLNPVAHAEIFGTIIFPLVGMFTGLPVFGWAKPVPVNARNLKNEKSGMFLVALAGPGSNVIMAALGALAYETMARYMVASSFSKPINEMVGYFIIINVALAIFNLIPLHPLDGGKIFGFFFPENVNRKIEENQMLVMIILTVFLFSGFFNDFFVPLVDNSARILDVLAYKIVSVL